MQSTTREAKTQLMLTLIAMAVGVVVFLTTSDFIIGVGVGAAAFALSRQVVRLWGHKESSHAEPVEQPDHEPAHR